VVRSREYKKGTSLSYLKNAKETHKPFKEGNLEMATADRTSWCDMKMYTEGFQKLFKCEGGEETQGPLTEKEAIGKA